MAGDLHGHAGPFGMTTEAASDALEGETEARSAAEGMQVLLFDPSPLSRSCLLAGFGDSRDISIVACGDLNDLADTAFSGGHPDIIAVHAAGQDIESPDFARRVQSLARRFPAAARILLSGPDNIGQMRAGLQLGFSAYVTAGVGLAPTIGVMQLIRQGMMIYPRDLMKSYKDKPEGADLGLYQASSSWLGDETLTPRQLDVLRLLARGLSNKAIATDLHISESTVKVHIRAIMERTGMLNRTQIVALFFGGSK